MSKSKSLHLNLKLPLGNSISRGCNATKKTLFIKSETTENTSIHDEKNAPCVKFHSVSETHNALNQPHILPPHTLLHTNMLQDLPEDVQEQLLALLPQSSQSRLAQTCTTLNELSLPLLARAYRCVTCRAHLFHPRELCFTPDDLSPTPAHGPTSRLPRRVFIRLITNRSLDAMGITLDTRLGAANFHVLRHLSQTIYKERFPLPAQLQSVRALRCANCGVFVGFRHSHDEIRDFIHHDFVELVDGKDELVTLGGHRVPPPQNAVTCANSDCKNILFTRDDVLPWTHVLASSRLTDLDAYLEWDHSWSGAATASQPAFFVKRLEEGCASVRHVRPERLRQGEMVVGDVHCARCDNQIGWKFVSEVPDGDEVRNYDQVGRFGIIRTAVAPTEPRCV